MPVTAVTALIWFLVPLAIVLAGTWLALRYARGRGLFDQPGERRSHTVATPRGGGISIVIVMLLTLLVLGYLDSGLRPLMLAGAAGLLLVATVGWIDDHRPLSARLRLIVHAVSAGLLAAAVLLSGHGALAALFAFAAVLVLVNVWNFMDGIDGLAGSQAAIAALGYALVSAPGASTWLALALAGACCGFLPYNFPKARIFLGDVGSGALGLLLALLLVVLLTDTDTGTGFGSGAWPLLVLPLAAFLVDASLTLARRVLRGEAWWQPHVQHAYQGWSRRLGCHVPVTLAYAGWSAVGIAFMYGLTNTGQGFTIAAVAAAAWCLAGGLVWFLLQWASRKS